MKKSLALSILMIGFAAMLAAQVTFPYPPSAGSAIKASDMTANFGAINTQFTNLDSSHWSVATGGIAYTGGNIGLGQAPWSTDGPPRLTIKQGGAPNNEWMMLTNNSGTPQWYIANFPNGIDFSRYGQADGVFFIGNNGCVGINTTNPALPLDVQTGVAGYAASILNSYNSSTSGAPGLLIKAGNSSGTACTLVGFYQPNGTTFLGQIVQT
jgi:hypothetical protein